MVQGSKTSDIPHPACKLTLTYMRHDMWDNCEVEFW